MTYWLDTPTLDDLERVLVWRKTCPETLRTPRDLTDVEQQAFYRDCICNGSSKHRYYAVREHFAEVDPMHQPDETAFVALVSLENISWENGSCEIGLIVDPAQRGRSIGRQAVELVLEVAFDRLRLATCWGEAYSCNPNAGFWVHLTEQRYGGVVGIWPRRKFWRGELHDAILFTITEEGWRASRERVA